MEFVPTSHSNKTLVYNGYILLLKKLTKMDTSPDGNCLFNNISINLCGSEALSLKIKLASLFITIIKIE